MQLRSGYDLEYALGQKAEHVWIADDNGMMLSAVIDTGLMPPFGRLLVRRWLNGPAPGHGLLVDSAGQSLPGGARFLGWEAVGGTEHTYVFALQAADGILGEPLTALVTSGSELRRHDWRRDLAITLAETLSDTLSLLWNLGWNNTDFAGDDIFGERRIRPVGPTAYAMVLFSADRAVETSSVSPPTRSRCLRYLWRRLCAEDPAAVANWGRNAVSASILTFMAGWIYGMTRLPAQPNAALAAIREPPGSLMGEIWDSIAWREDAKFREMFALTSSSVLPVMELWSDAYAAMFRHEVSDNLGLTLRAVRALADAALGGPATMGTTSPRTRARIGAQIGALAGISVLAGVAGWWGGQHWRPEVDDPSASSPPGVTSDHGAAIEVGTLRNQAAALRSQLETTSIRSAESELKLTAMEQALLAAKREVVAMVGQLETARRDLDTATSNTSLQGVEASALRAEIERQRVDVVNAQASRDQIARKSEQLEASLSAARQEIAALRDSVPGIHSVRAPTEPAPHDGVVFLVGERLVAVRPTTLWKEADDHTNPAARVEIGDRLAARGGKGTEDHVSVTTEGGKPGFLAAKDLAREADWLSRLPRTNSGVISDIRANGAVALIAHGNATPILYRPTGIALLTPAGQASTSAWLASAPRSGQCVEIPAPDGRDVPNIVRCFFVQDNKRYDVGEFLLANQWIKQLSSDASASYRDLFGGSK